VNDITKLVKKVCDYIIEQMDEYLLRPGDLVNEEEIACNLGVSRTPIREAMSILSKDRLLRRLTGKGYIVEVISAEDLEEVYYLREVLEITALKLAFPHLETSRLVSLKGKIELLNMSSTINDFYRLDAEIHNMICETSGNIRLTEIINSLNLQVRRVRRMSVQEQDRLEASIKELKSLLEALIDKDLAQAEHYLRIHINQACENLITICKRMERTK